MLLNWIIANKLLVVAFLFVAAVAGCSDTTEPTPPSPVYQSLFWDTNWPCIDKQVVGQYTGWLEVRGLAPGERIKILYGDSVVFDSVAEQSGGDYYQFNETKQFLKNISVIYRRDTITLYSEDSMATHRLQPRAFPLYFIVDGSYMGYEGFSLLDMPSVNFKKMRCAINDTNGNYDILPDTLKIPGNKINISMLADFYDNVYDIKGSYLDTEGRTRNFFSYLEISSVNGRRSNLFRRKFDLQEEIPNFPAWITFRLAAPFPTYELRIEKSDIVQTAKVGRSTHPN
jgi:hypothetical protein